MTPVQETRLHAYIDGLRGQPFVYGQNDCPLLAAGALDCMDEGQRRAEMTGLWSDHASAWRYIRRHGDIDAHLIDQGCVPVPGGISYAQPGDFLLMERTLIRDKRWHSVGVCLGGQVAIMTEDQGLMLVRQRDLPTVVQVLRWQ